MFLLFSTHLLFAQKLSIRGNVENALTNEAVPKARVELYDLQGNKMGKSGMVLGFSNNKQRSSFYLSNVVPGKYKLRYLCDGFETKEISITVPFKKNAISYSFPTVRLMPKSGDKKEKQLKDVVVKATRVKFYTKNDTLVFNADAFQMANGSMLDALIRQLPGVELKDNGQIYVNGRYVESLVMNGQDFFRNDRSVMLENLPAYMVKDVKVYERERSEAARMVGATTVDRKELVMDVNLKRQYQIGWVANTEVGYGTEDRYLARLFALRFTPHSRLSFIGNLNNVNDKRKPGQTTSWTPEMLTGGHTRQKQVMMDLNINDARNRFTIKGDASLTHTDDNLTTRTDQRTFLADGDVFGTSKQGESGHNLGLKVNQQTLLKFGEKSTLDIRPKFSYSRSTNKSGGVSGTFNSDPYERVRHGLIDSLRAPLKGSVLRDLMLNRTLTSAQSERTKVSPELSTEYSHYSRWNNDYYRVKVYGRYNMEKEERFRHYQLDYNADKTDFRNEYYNNRPDKSYEYGLLYFRNQRLNKKWHMSLSYDFKHQYKANRRSLYRLDGLSGFGVDDESSLGTLPSLAGWQIESLDAQNSFDYKVHSYNHRPSVQATGNLKIKKHRFQVNAGLVVPVMRQSMNYHSNAQTQTPSRSDVFVEPYLMLEYSEPESKSGLFQIEYNNQNFQPEMRNLIDLRDESNPLWITWGNPNLKNTHEHQVNFLYSKSYKKSSRFFDASVKYNVYQNAVAMKTEYDKETGARTSSPENVNGNWGLNGQGYYYIPLDKKERLTLTSNTDIQFLRNVDLTSVDGIASSGRSVVKNLYLTEEIKLDYQFKKLKLGGRVKGSWGHITGNRSDFETMNTGDATYTLTAQYTFPKDFQISTDLNLYSRYGYTDPSMNTSDFVWNARVSKSVLHGSMVLLLDGFDLLHQLSNVTRVVNAQARTETYRNVLPSYLMAHVIYRLNIKPKKRPGEEK